MICINFYGGPGVGKSTIAAEVFACLKRQGVRTELVGEFAKDLSYEKSYNTMADQPYLFSEQAHRLWRLDQAGIEVAVCDSPLLLNLAYNKDPNNGYFVQFIIDTYKRYRNLDYILRRNESFWNSDEHRCDIQWAIKMDQKIDALLLDVLKEACPAAKLEVDESHSIASSIAGYAKKLVKSSHGERAKQPAEQLRDEPWRTTN